MLFTRATISFDFLKLWAAQTISMFGSHISLLFGLACPIFSINQLSLRQSLTPTHLQRRMNATITCIVYGLPIIGAFAGGISGQLAGLQTTLVVAAPGEMLACVLILLSPIRNVQTLTA